MKNLVFFALLFLSCNIFGQKEDSLVFSKIINIENKVFEDFENENVNNINLQNLLSNYNDFLLKFPQSDYKFSALEGKASAEFALKDYDSAKKSYLNVLIFFYQNKNPKDPFLRVPYSQGNQFLYELFKKLAHVEMAQSNYNQAIKYLDESQKNAVRISCGNGFISEVLYMAYLYSECYSNLNDDEKICDVLIPITAIPVSNQNSITIIMLYNTLLKKHSKKEIKKLFEESFKVVYSKEGIINNNNMTIYYVKFMNRDIILYENFKNLPEKEVKEKLNTILNHSKFYTFLSK